MDKMTVDTDWIAFKIPPLALDLVYCYLIYTKWTLTALVAQLWES